MPFFLLITEQMPSAYKIKPSQVRQGEKQCQHGTHAQRCRGTGTGGSTQLGRRSLTRDTTLELRLAPRKQQLGQQLSLGSGVGWPEAGCDGAGAELRVRRQLWGHGGPRGEEGSAGELPWGPAPVQPHPRGPAGSRIALEAFLQRGGKSCCVTEC